MCGISTFLICHRECEVEDRLVNVDNIVANDIDENSRIVYRVGKNEVVSSGELFKQCFGDCESMNKARECVRRKSGMMLEQLATRTKEKLINQGVSLDLTDLIYHQVELDSLLAVYGMVGMDVCHVCDFCL